ncbi:leucine--tRNA ligase [archaeon]|nr:leucine--tRNA ligase [archaeon]
MYNFKKIEKKWQDKWEKSKSFEVKKTKKKKYYVLEMFPYPSASGLHMGHAFNYTVGDIYTRYKRMNGFNVLYTMGYDSFGLPAENAAIKAGEHPKKFTENSIKNFIKQQKALGLSYDWSRLVKTSDQEYYKWNQFFFLKFLEKDLVYRKKAPVNWCNKCNTVLANEQVHNGKCWRHPDTDVIEKELEQWFIKTTKYADELLRDIEKLQWPERIKIMQKNWIGKSYGTEIIFKINEKPWQVFTTRPDTIFGVTFMVISAKHPKLFDLVTNAQRKEVNYLLKKIKSTTDLEVLDKEGAFTGSYAINPLNNEKVPVYVGNFVVADYGSGMVMAVPAHDERDFQFAKKYNIPIKQVITPDYELNVEKMSRAYVSEGNLINSQKFNKLNNKDAIEEITKELTKKKLGKKTIQYKLKDWLVSRQRYWGTPIPIIYCKKCGIVPEKNIPVKLPDKVKFGKGNPLETNKEFVNVKCPKCKSNARRETDTMDTFFDSSWYFLRYTDPKNKTQPFNKEKVNYWMPVDQYIGGAEHACMHLIYARFFQKALRDLKFLKGDEPFTKLFNQGMLHGEDGVVMSKSRGNVVLPETISKKYGIDAARFFLVSIASPDKDIQWSDKGIQHAFRFVNKLHFLSENKKFGKSKDKIILSKINFLIDNVTNNIENFEYNKALISITEFTNYLHKNINLISKNTFTESYNKLLTLLHPFIPHLTSELKCSNKWPKVEKKKINLELEYQEDFIDNVIYDISEVINLTKIDPRNIKLIITEKWKYNFYKKVKKELEKSRDFKKIIKKVLVKGYEKEISKIIPSLIKDPNKIPKIILTQEKELKILKENINLIKNKFVSDINITTAESAEEMKQSSPGKPAIILK